MEGISVVCFFASYLVALAMELLHQFRPRPVFRLVALGFGVAGLVAQTLYLYTKQPPLFWQFSWLVFVAWILAIFYLSGAIHYRQLAWGIFVLPLILALLGLARLFGTPPADARGWVSQDLRDVHQLWGPVHVVLLLLATIGVCVGFLASLMYLYQSHRLRAKTPPGRGLKLLSLERLEAMQRRAVVLAFPLLTGGVLAGIALLIQGSDRVTWTDPRVLSTIVLWIVFAALLILRYARHLRGRQAAFLTIATFVLLLGCVALAHPSVTRVDLP
jgi:ABC-type transport system involved in cytochrome c biogenesis permease subunit